VTLSWYALASSLWVATVLARPGARDSSEPRRPWG